MSNRQENGPIHFDFASIESLLESKKNLTKEYLRTQPKHGTLVLMGLRQML